MTLSRSGLIMTVTFLLLSSLIPQTTSSHCSQISTRDLFVCPLGRVEFPSKRSVDLLSRDLVRDGWFDGWHERDEKRTEIGVSSKLWHGLASDGGKRRRLLMYDEEWVLGSLLMPQRFYLKIKKVFKILVRETLVRDEGESGVAEGMQWKAFSILACVLFNRKIIASYKDMSPNLLDTRKG
ncbi:hypothetical protein V6N13_094329 [Hibiscus sabdariffa]